MKNSIYIFLLFLISCSDSSNKPSEVAQTDKKDTVIITTEPKVISDPTNVLDGRVQQLELDYIAWGCACANWITPSDMLKYQDSGLDKHCIFIEPADSSLLIPNYFQPDTHRIIVKGQFYVKEDYPQGTIQTEEDLEKAKVFKYTKIKIISK